MLRPLFAASLFASASFLVAAPAVPLVNLVDDQTLAVFSVTDAPALVRGWDAGPMAKSWADPEMMKFLAPLRTQLEIDTWDEQAKEATGLTVRELLALAKGEVLIALPTFAVSGPANQEQPPVIVAIEVGDQTEKIEKILAEALAKESVQEETEIFSGVKVHSRPLAKVKEEELASVGVATDDADEVVKAAKPEILHWAMVDGIWLLSLDKTRVLVTIDAVKQGGVASPLGKSERFLRTRERIGGAQALGYVNFPALTPLLRDMVAEFKKQSRQARARMMGIDPSVVLDALGLDVLGEGYLAVTTGDKETLMETGLTYTEERGLVKLIAYEPGPVTQADWIPAKWPSVSTMRFSIPKSYAALSGMLDSISPMLAAMAHGQIRAFNKQSGVDLERDLIGSLGNEVLSAHVPPAEVEAGKVAAWADMGQLFALTLANPTTFTNAVEALKRLAGPGAEQLFIKRDYLGQTIYTFNSPGGPQDGGGFSYAIANGTLLLGIGPAGGIESALQGMAAKEGLFWKRDDVKAVMMDIPAEAVGIQVQDMKYMAESLIEMAVQLQSAETASDEKAEKFIEVTARPDPAVIARYWGMAGGYTIKTTDGLFTKTRILHPQP